MSYIKLYGVIMGMLLTYLIINIKKLLDITLEIIYIDN